MILGHWIDRSKTNVSDNIDIFPFQYKLWLHACHKIAGFGGGMKQSQNPNLKF